MLVEGIEGTREMMKGEFRRMKLGVEFFQPSSFILQPFLIFAAYTSANQQLLP